MKKKGMPTLTKPNWLIIINEHTGLKQSRFFKLKNEIMESIPELFQVWQEDFAHKVPFVCCDNAGENVAFKNNVNSQVWKLGVKLEFTTCITPQQKNLAKLVFISVSAKGHD
jgi:hypothetical protein